MKRKIDIEQVKHAFEQKGYTLVSQKYSGYKTKLDFVCANGHHGRMSLDFLERGVGCALCYQKDNSPSMTQIVQAFRQRGYQLLSKEYQNCYTKLHYICSKGHNGLINWKTFKRGGGCPVCDDECKKHTIEQIRSFFEKEGYVLLSGYLNCKSKVKYKCPRGHIHDMSWNSFQHGNRCPECWEYKNEKKLGKILEQIFPEEVKRQDNLGFLGLQRVDYSVRKFFLAFEYDGLHHFQPVCFRGISIERAEKNFVLQRKNDRRKNQLCKKNGYILIRITYKDRLDLESVHDILKQKFGTFLGI